MSALLRFALIGICLAVAAFGDGVPLSLQGTWDGQVTYSSLTEDSPSNCCPGSYAPANQGPPGRFDLGTSTPFGTNQVSVDVTETSVFITNQSPDVGVTSCDRGLPSNVSITGITLQDPSFNCFVGTFAFEPAYLGLPSFPCTFSLDAAGNFAMDFVRCYWMSLLSSAPPCPNEVVAGPDGFLGTVVVDQCAIFNAGGYSASSWYTTPAAQPWTHTYTPPDPNCHLVGPTNGNLGSCADPLLNGASCSFQCDSGYQLTGPAFITCTNGQASTLQTCVLIPPSNGHCGVEISPGVCQVGFIGAPDCCTRLSNQSPVASATESNGNVHFQITSNVVPTDYQYFMGLSETTNNFFTCDATNVVVTPIAGGQQVSSWDVPLTSLHSCLNTQLVAPGLRYQGYVVLSLQYVPWGSGAFMGLYFFGVNIDFSNTTSTVTVLTVTQELTGADISVVVNPTAYLRHCVSVPCVTEDPTYYSRVGDTEIYQIVVDTNGQAGTASVQSVVFEDHDHHAIAFTTASTLLSEGLNVTFGFVVPSGVDDVRYVHVTVQITFNGGSVSQFDSETFNVLANPPTLKTYVAQSRFELLGSSAASTLQVCSALVVIMLAVMTLL